MDEGADGRDSALAHSTRQAYRSDWTDFTAWCRARGISPLPASAETVARYLMEQAETYKFSTLQRRMVSITHAHKVTGLVSPIAHPVVREAWDRITSPQRPFKPPGEKDSWSERLARVKGASDLMFY